MPFYESVFIARQDLSAQAVEALADQFAELIKTNGGSVEKREYWGLRNLSYRIKKNRKGHYILFGVDASAPTIKEFERHMGLNENLLRHLTIRVDSLDPEPSPMMNAGNDRGEDEKPYARKFSSSRDYENRQETRSSQGISKAHDPQPAEIRRGEEIPPEATGGNAAESTYNDAKEETDKEERGS